MYKTRAVSSGSMGSLRRDYVARIPIDLNSSPLSSKAIHAAAAASSRHRYGGGGGGGTARLLIGGGGSGPDVVQNGGVSLVRCRVDSDNSPNVIGYSDDDDDYDYEDAYHVTQHRHQKPQETMTSGAGDVSVRSWSTSSEGRETGSILKKPEYGGGGGGGSQTLNDRSGKQRTPQGRRRVRFTNNVSLYRFDSDGVDSAYSSSECERLYAPISAVVARRPGTPNNRSPSTPTQGSNSNSNSTLSSTNRTTYSMNDDTYDSAPRSVVVNRRIQDDNKALTLSSPPPPPSLPLGIIRQEVRAPQVLHGTPNGSLYFRNNHEKTKAVLPSTHWISRTPPPPPPVSSSSSSSSQKQGSLIVGSSSGALRATSYTVISDAVTHERKLVVAAKLADSFHPNDITIKANKNGNKIRIVSIKSPPHSFQGSSRHQALNEQILLPVQVDPWKLTARLDPNGSLHIEAPCAD